MARLWIAYREGLRLVGHVVANVSLERAVPRLDIASWRLFADAPPDEVPAERVRERSGRKRVLLEVRDEDRGDLCGLEPGFFDSPYSPAEAMRRLDLS